MNRPKYEEYAENYEPPVIHKLKLRTGTKRQRSPNLAAKSTVKRKRAAPPSLPKGARYASPVRISAIRKEEAMAFKKHIMSLPMYVISAHACLCDKGECIGEKYSETFTVPKNTFIMNLTYPGDTFCMTSPEVVIRDNSEELRKYLLAHSTSDTDSAGKYVHHSLFGDVKRAAAGPPKDPVKYLNISYTLNEKIEESDSDEIEPPERNPYGVYRIQDLIKRPVSEWNNKMSVLPQEAKRVNWFLHDIIKEVYKAEKIGGAIFISTGCMSECNKKKGLPDDVIAEYQHIFDIANVRYNALYPTLTKDEIVATYGKSFVAKDRGLSSPSSGVEGFNMMRLVKEGLIDPKATVEEYPNIFWDKEDRDKFLEAVDKWEKETNPVIRSLPSRKAKTAKRG